MLKVELNLAGSGRTCRISFCSRLNDPACFRDFLSCHLLQVAFVSFVLFVRMCGVGESPRFAEVDPILRAKSQAHLSGQLDHSPGPCISVWLSFYFHQSVLLATDFTALARRPPMPRGTYLCHLKKCARGAWIVGNALAS